MIRHKLTLAIATLPRLTLVFLMLTLPVANAGSWQEWQSSIDAGTAAMAQEDIDAAEQSFEDALAMAEANDPADPRLTQSLDNLAEARFLQNRDAEAEALYRRALARREAALGPDDLAVAQSLKRLADLLYFNDRNDEAEPLYLRALAIGEQSDTPGGPLEFLAGIARFYNFIGRESEAWPYLERELALRTARLGPDHIDLAATLDAMAEAQFYLDKLDQAETLYRRSLTLREAAYGANDRQVAGSIRRLASVIRMRGREAEAGQWIDRALTIEQNQPDP